MSEIEEFIEQYKRELLGEAELARDDVREIEDHLRTLTAELRASGMSAAEAVRTAGERVGEPRVVAREHAKVSSPFGARLSRARALSAAGLLLVVVVSSYARLWTGWDRIAFHFLFLGGASLCAVLAMALLARLTWARAATFGALGFTLVFGLVVGMARDASALLLLPMAGTVVFVMPWGRNELRRSGYAVALQAFAFAAVVFGAGTLGLDVEMLARARAQMAAIAGGPIHIAPAALVGFLPGLLAIIGTIARARWAALASAFAAAMLSVSIIEVVRYHLGFHQIEYLGDWLPLASMLFAGALTSTIAAVTSWRSAQSTAGTLRYVLR